VRNLQEAVPRRSEADVNEVCEIGDVDDGTLRVCCSTHQVTMCAHHYARTHFVETDPAWPHEFACDRPT
jgi:hypothetical protein